MFLQVCVIDKETARILRTITLKRKNNDGLLFMVTKIKLQNTGFNFNSNTQFITYNQI